MAVKNLGKAAFGVFILAAMLGVVTHAIEANATTGAADRAPNMTIAASGVDSFQAETKKITDLGLEDIDLDDLDKLGEFDWSDMKHYWDQAVTFFKEYGDKIMAFIKKMLDEV